MSITNPKRQNIASFSEAGCEASPCLCGFTIYVLVPNLQCSWFKFSIHRILLCALFYYLTPPLMLVLGLLLMPMGLRSLLCFPVVHCAVVCVL